MGDPRGFINVRRKKAEYRPVDERVSDYKSVNVARAEDDTQKQASRCMDCGVPFCHWGCPVGNYIPEWNDLLFEGSWEKAYRLLAYTNNFPEITGRVCPALCEYACVLGINDDPVTICENELAIMEYAFGNGMVRPCPPAQRTGKKVAVVGSGPAGLACADQLNRAGHDVTVYEKDDRIGGLLRYGIPDFKLEKDIIDRRLGVMGAEGITFRTSVNVGVDLPAVDLISGHDAICLTGGSRAARDLDIEGRDLEGIYFAMDYLSQSNRRVAGDAVLEEDMIDAKGKKVVVIGGGDTGSDCVGTANRQGAASIVQIEVMPKPQETRPDEMPWPMYPTLLKTSSSHEEGCQRHWSVLTKKFAGTDGNLKKLECVKVEFVKEPGAARPVMKEIPDSEFTIEADMAFLAVGFVHPEHEGLLAGLGTELDARGNVKTDGKYMTSVDKVFSAGDMRRGQSLVVWAVSEGRQAAYNIDIYLTGSSRLPNI